MDRARSIPAGHPELAALPVRDLTVGGAGERIAVHVAGRFDSSRLPLICLPGYQRNMADYAYFLRLFQRDVGGDWPAVLVDLRGRGRSSDRAAPGEYLSHRDARDLGNVATALGITAAVMVGQGFGGQVIMALGAHRPWLIAASVLIDAGPVGDPHGLVRLRTNLTELAGVTREANFRRMARRILRVDYPGQSEEQLDRLALRTHLLGPLGAPAPLFDPRLISLLAPFTLHDVLAPQWPLFNTLAHAPMLLMRTEFTEQLRRDIFQEMLARRPDAEGFEIDEQGSPALLDTPAHVAPIAAFVRSVSDKRLGATRGKVRAKPASQPRRPQAPEAQG